MTQRSLVALQWIQYTCSIYSSIFFFSSVSVSCWEHKNFLLCSYVIYKFFMAMERIEFFKSKYELNHSLQLSWWHGSTRPHVHMCPFTSYQPTNKKKEEHRPNNSTLLLTPTKFDSSIIHLQIHLQWRQRQNNH